jgi:hypothetical protein
VSVLDMCLTRERLGHGYLRVRGVSSRKIIIFYSGHGRDTFQTRLRHSNVKIEKKKKKKKRKKKELCKLAALEPLRLSDLPSCLSCVSGCSLLIACVCFFSFFLSAFQSCRSFYCFSPFSISLLFFFFFNPHACSVGWETYTLVVFSVHWDWVPCFHYSRC